MQPVNQTKYSHWKHENAAILRKKRTNNVKILPVSLNETSLAALPASRRRPALMLAAAALVANILFPASLAQEEKGKEKKELRCDLLSGYFFRKATSSDVSRCLKESSNPDELINSKAENGVTPLHLAVAFNTEPKVIRVLLAAGADITLRDKYGKTPMHLAAGKNSQPRIIEALLNAGADIENRSDGGLTALHWAAIGNPQSTVIKLLLRAGAQINDRAEDGATPLHFAAANNPKHKVADELLAAGADVTLRDDEQYTPLHMAAISNPSPTVIKSLLKAGADINSIDINGDTALHLAIANNPEKAVVDALKAESPEEIGIVKLTGLYISRFVNLTFE